MSKPNEQLMGADKDMDKNKDIHALAAEHRSRDRKTGVGFLWLFILFMMVVVVGAVVYIFYAPIVRTKYDTYKKGESSRYDIGVKSEALSKEGLAKFNGEVEYGVFVNEVISDGLAYRAGVMRGDIILKVNSHKITRPKDISKALKKTKSKNTVHIIVKRLKDDKYEDYDLTCKIK
ncbi:MULTISPECIES: PDZ domain-containing protein [Eubacterium]|uniref:PDZ domain-containing protein n=1 Tax=Eubacterium uniforme TaxID=39495 RepID=A0A1T4VQV5_9FIRM|nr:MULTISPECIES: PDZ domain-containing protein [Eubacterium]MCR5628789.1 PDZ domain-containing protein [Eubacterium sp.]SKA67327.1 PDZ domain-containing protein [Eubacterium uniforme]